MVRISVIGLGKLGAPLAAVMASKGHTVIGVDVSKEYVAALNEGKPPVEEPRLAEMIRENGERLSATHDCVHAVESSDITFIIVPTPSAEDGTFSMKYVLAAADPIGRAIKNKKSFHVVVLTSTVMPGDTGGQLLPALERISGKKCGRDFGLCYNPEFIALGSVIRDMLRTDLTLIGESDAKSGQILADLYAGVVESKPRVARMNFVNAELTKIAINTFVTTKISYANMLAEVCEQLPEADVDVVTGALGADSRIGGKYLKGALGYGGPCFPRDNIAFAALAHSRGVKPHIPEATDHINRFQIKRLARKVLGHLSEGARVGIMGLSYKPGSDVVEQSQAIGLALELMEAGVPLVVHDPAAMKSARRVLGEEVQYADTMEECIKSADFLAIMTAWETYKELTPVMLRREGSRLKVFDPWRMLADTKFGEVVERIWVGVGTQCVPTIVVNPKLSKLMTAREPSIDELAESPR